MMNEVGNPKIVTSTGVVESGSGKIIGFFVATGTPTLVLDDSTDGSGTVILNGVVCTAGTYYPFPAAFSNGLYVTQTNAGSVTYLVG